MGILHNRRARERRPDHLILRAHQRIAAHIAHYAQRWEQRVAGPAQDDLRVVNLDAALSQVRAAIQGFGDQILDRTSSTSRPIGSVGMTRASSTAGVANPFLLSALLSMASNCNTADWAATSACWAVASCATSARTTSIGALVRYPPASDCRRTAFGRLPPPLD